MWSLIFSIAAAVLVFSPSNSVTFVPTKTFVLAAGAVISLALFILARLSRGNLVAPPLSLLGALWLPTAAALLSAIFSGTSMGQAFWGIALEPDTLGFMLIVSVLGTLCALVIRRTEHYRTFLHSLLWVIGIVVVVQLLVVLSGNTALGIVSPSFSIIGTPQDLAFVLGLFGIAILLAVRFLELMKPARVVLYVGGGLTLALLAILNVFSVWIMIALVSLGLFVEAIMKRRAALAEGDVEEGGIVPISMEVEERGDESANQSFLVPVITLFTALFFLLGTTFATTLAEAFEVRMLSVRPSWESTLQMANETYGVSPVFGTGPGTFASEWLKHRDASLNSTVFWNVDFSSGVGIIPTTFVTTGFVGALAWLAFLGIFFFMGARMLLWRAPSDPFVRFTAILSFVSAAYLFLLAFFDVPGPVILTLAFIFAGLFISTTRYSAEGWQWGIVFARSPRVGFVIVLGLTLVLIAPVGAAYALVERYGVHVQLAKANEALARGDLIAAGEAAQKATEFAASPVAYLAQANIARAQLNNILSSTSLPREEAERAFQATISTGVAAALSATRLAPENYQAWLSLGSLYAIAVPLKVSGAYESAKQAYDRGAVLNPTNPTIPYIIAQLELAQGNTAAAKEHLKKATALKQDYTPAILLLSQIEVSSGNVQEALASALAAAYFTPQDPTILFQVGILRAASSDLPGAIEALSAAIAANPQYANARYFLAAAYARQKNYSKALAEIEAIEALSPDNAQQVASVRTALAEGRDPFPANLLSVSSTPTP